MKNEKVVIRQIDALRNTQKFAQKWPLLGFFPMINNHFYKYFAMNNTHGPSMPRGHPCPGSIYLESHQCPLNRANTFRGPIYAEDPSLPGAHPSRGPIGHRAPSMPMAHHCWPIDANGPAEGPSLPRSHPSRGSMGVHRHPGPFPA